MNEQIENVLSQANDLREKEQFAESAKLYTQCLLELIPDGSPSQTIHCLDGQSLIYKILARKENHLVYRHLTLAYAAEAFRIAETNPNNLENNAQSTASISYADALLMDGQIKESLPYFEEALKTSTAEKPEEGRIKAHIGGVKYVLGDKEIGINLIREALADIRTGDLSTYPVRVWETGALNGLAKIYAKEGNIEEAKRISAESLQIATDHSLSIRKREVEEIIAKISSGSTDFSL